MDERRVYDPTFTHWWPYRTLEQQRDGNTGQDDHGCRVLASIDGDVLRVQHGDDQTHCRWFTLDELNNVGQPFDYEDPVLKWCDTIHRKEVR